MVCELFHGTAPEGAPEALHSCDNPPCCNPGHVGWGSQSVNLLEMYERNRQGERDQVRGERVNTAKLTESDVRTILSLHAGGASQRGLGRRFSVTQANIYRIVHGETWKHLSPLT